MNRGLANPKSLKKYRKKVQQLRLQQQPCCVFSLTTKNPKPETRTCVRALGWGGLLVSHRHRMYTHIRVESPIHFFYSDSFSSGCVCGFYRLVEGEGERGSLLSLTSISALSPVAQLLCSAHLRPCLCLESPPRGTDSESTSTREPILDTPR